jgi:hypothetical protein
MHAAAAFGIAYKADEATLKALARYGVDLEAWSGEAHRLLTDAISTPASQLHSVLHDDNRY